jgi:hypothetical protein
MADPSALPPADVLVKKKGITTASAEEYMVVGYVHALRVLL